MQISFEQFAEQYKPIQNPNHQEDDNDLFETYGEELDFVRQQPNNLIWTLVDSDNGLVLIPGYHFVNRVNYMVAEVAWENEDIEVKYCDELDD